MTFENPEDGKEQDLPKERAQEESETLSRFGGKAGRIARMVMLATALAGSYEVATHFDSVSKKYTETMRGIDGGIDNFIDTHGTAFDIHGTGQVVNKKYIPESDEVTWTGSVAVPTIIPASYEVTVVINNQTHELRLENKDQFDSLNTGDTVSVEYQGHQLGPLQHLNHAELNRHE